MSQEFLQRYISDLQQLIAESERNNTPRPFKRGSFMVSAIAEDVEMDIANVTEEDAILIVSELSEFGINAVMRDSVICKHCEERVPKQSFCINCRKKLIA